MNMSHDNKHIAILSRFVVDCELDPVLDLECDKCVRFVDYVTTIDDFGSLVLKKKEDLDKTTVKLFMHGKMDN